MKDAVEATGFHLREPTPEEMANSEAAASALANMRSEDGTLVIQTGEVGSVKIESSIADQLIELLDSVSDGNLVGLVPSKSRITTHLAAEILNVPHGYLMKLLEEGEILHLPPRYHRRVSLVDLMRYMEQRDRERSAALKELARLGQEWDAA